MSVRLLNQFLQMIVKIKYSSFVRTLEAAAAQGLLNRYDFTFLQTGSDGLSFTGIKDSR